MFILAFIGKVFLFFGNTTSENFITFEVNSRRVLVVPTLFNKGFDFKSEVTDIFIILFKKGKSFNLRMIWAFLGIELFLKNLEKR